MTVKGAELAYGFDPATGLLASIQWKGAELLASPLRPDFWRAPNDNDRGSDMMKRLGIWRDAHRFLAVRSVKTETPAPGIVRIAGPGRAPFGRRPLRPRLHRLRHRRPRGGRLVRSRGGEAARPPALRHAGRPRARLRAPDLVRAGAGGDLRRSPGPPGGPLRDDRHRQLLPVLAAPGDRQQGRGPMGDPHGRLRHGPLRRRPAAAFR